MEIVESRLLQIGEDRILQILETVESHPLQIGEALILKVKQAEELPTEEVTQGHLTALIL